MSRADLEGQARDKLSFFSGYLSIDPEQLRQAGEALMMIADAMSAALYDGAQPRNAPQGPAIHAAETSNNDEKLASLAAGIYKSRRRRTEYFPKGYFTDPAWDLLLDLFVNDVRRQHVTVSGVCPDALPPTTTVRWIHDLVKDGLVERIPVRHDRRAIQVRLTQDGRRLMRLCLSQWLAATRI